MTAIGMTANPAYNALLDSFSMGAVRFVAATFWANQILGYSISGSFSSTDLKSAQKRKPFPLRLHRQGLDPGGLLSFNHRPWIGFK